MTTPAAFLSSNSQNWATPWPVIEALEAALGARFTLDVCASAKSAKAPKYYTEEMDAFKQDWGRDAGEGLAWCNPPYVDGWPGKFLKRAQAESAHYGLTTVFLLPANKTDQGWWADLVIPYAAVWDVRGRIDFLDPDTGEVPKVWKWNEEAKKSAVLPSGVTFEETYADLIGSAMFGRWVKQSNPQASKIVIVGPGFGPCLPRSFVWKK